MLKNFFLLQLRKFILRNYLLKEIKNLKLNFENCFYAYI